MTAYSSIDQFVIAFSILEFANVKSITDEELPELTYYVQKSGVFIKLHLFNFNHLTRFSDRIDC